MVYCRQRARCVASFSLLLAAIGAVPAGFAQAPATLATASSSSTQAPEEIIVTARKRNETAIDVPVAITALGKTDLDRYSTRDLVSLSSQVPGLIIQPIPGGGGGSIALRGVSSSPTNPAIDQAVSFNVDGVEVGSANIMRLGQIDLHQIEILKGPQALFFGKNSPAGIISMRSADPSDHFELNTVVSHEFKADENTGQVAVSVPITDNLAVRMVGYGRTMEGYRNNLSPDINDPAHLIFARPRTRYPQIDEYFFRGTVVYQPTDDLSIRAKYNFNHLWGSDPWNTAERLACPYGKPQTGAGGVPAQLDDCKVDGNYYQGQPDPRVRAALPDFFPFYGTDDTQHLASLEANYNLTDDVTLTSVTGYYQLHEGFFGPSVYQPASLLISGTDTQRREISEEGRITTSMPDWPVNFMLGAYYQDLTFSNFIPLIFDTPGVPVGFTGSNSYNQFYINGTAYSIFGQAIWKVIDTVEFAAGARYSGEEKNLTFYHTTGLPGALTRALIQTSQPRENFHNVSPEVTLKWEPMHNLTLFAAWRNGFTSGGFNTGGGGAPGVNLTYHPEDARGEEIGVKTVLGDVRLDATAYRYKYKNLQVSTFDPTTARQTVVNAAGSTVQGIEGDATWNVHQVAGLELRSALNWNSARYDNFLVGCNNGQTIAQGCNLNPNPATGAFRQQNFHGRQLTLAPELTANVGFSETIPLNSEWNFSLSGDANYSSSFYAQLEEEPLGRQSDYWMFDAAARVADAAGRWELALIGQNLSQVYRAGFVSQVPGTGITARTGTNIPGGLSDLDGQINRGRQIRLQLTYNID